MAPQRFAVKFTIGEDDQKLLEHIRDLLAHQDPSANIADVFVRALHVLARDLEKRKYAATDRPRSTTSPADADSRHIPAEVRRLVSERDGGQCAFVARSGRRCRATRQLEFDHIVPVAQGGRSTVENVRLLCRDHNQLEAEKKFGQAFMEEKRRARTTNGSAMNPRDLAANAEREYFAPPAPQPPPAAP